jgi:NadR type nicotinamide-nucleotide adenylyltransferase
MGLVVGKFSPLHRGHEFLINRALEQCREVAVISFAKPEYAGNEAKRREQWLKALFPTVRSLVVTDERLAAWLPGRNVSVPHDDEPETVHRRFCGLLCRELLGVTVDAVFTSEDYGDGFAAELGRYFREHDPQASPITHLLVDRQRQRIPVSGTLIRSDVHGFRNMLSPQVYASFVQRICMLGGESTGKSTLAAALARNFDTIHVEEYGRILWEQKDGQLVYNDMLAIGKQQVAMEEAALLKANRYLFCDTSPLTTYFYSRTLFGKSDRELERLAEHSYDLVVLCELDVPFVQDGTRQQPKFRHEQHNWYLEELAQRGISFVRVNGSLDERVTKVGTALEYIGIL